MQLYQGEWDSLSGKMRSGQNSNKMRERSPRNLQNVPGREESRCKALGLQEPLGSQKVKERGIWRVRRETGGMQGEAGGKAWWPRGAQVSGQV